MEKDFYKGEISNSTKVTRVAQIVILPLLWQKIPTRMGFEPTRAEPIGLAVQRLNHSATSSMQNWYKHLVGNQNSVWRGGKRIPTPGVEPGPPGWKPDILAIRPRGKNGNLNLIFKSYNHSKLTETFWCFLQKISAILQNIFLICIHLYVISMEKVINLDFTDFICN